MQSLTVHFVGPVRRPGPERTLSVDRTGLDTIGDLLAKLGYSPEEQRSLQVLLDGSRADLDAQLQEAKTVEILIAIGGG